MTDHYNGLPYYKGTKLTKQNSTNLLQGARHAKISSLIEKESVCHENCIVLVEILTKKNIDLTLQVCYTIYSEIYSSEIYSSKWSLKKKSSLTKYNKSVCLMKQPTAM